jgi:hypothetical protein
VIKARFSFQIQIIKVFLDEALECCLSNLLLHFQLQFCFDGSIIAHQQHYFEFFITKFICSPGTTTSFPSSITTTPVLLLSHEGLLFSNLTKSTFLLFSSAP